MPARPLSALACLSLLVIALQVFAATVTGPVVVLPNSYYLQPDKAGQTKLVRHDGTRLLPGTIAAYSVTGEMVTGAIGAVPPAGHQITNDLDFAGGPDTHYFVLDTATGKLETDLDEAAWRERLNELGQHDVHLYPPLPWQS